MGGKQSKRTKKPSSKITTAAGGEAAGRRARCEGLGAPTGLMVNSPALGCKNPCGFIQEPATAAGSSGVRQDTAHSQSTAPNGRGKLLAR